MHWGQVSDIAHTENKFSFIIARVTQNQIAHRLVTLIDQPDNRPINQSINQSINHSLNSKRM
jgi:hypothetical protein